MDTEQTQFVVQDLFYKFEKMTENGESLWHEINLHKKRIVWLNPHNGFSIAALKDVDFEIRLPNAYETYEENFAAF